MQSEANQKWVISNLHRFTMKKIDYKTIGLAFFGRLLWFDCSSLTAFLDDDGKLYSLVVKPFHASYFPPELTGQSLRIVNLGMKKSRRLSRSFYRVLVEKNKQIAF